MSQPLSLCEVEERGLQLRRKRADVRGVNHRRQIYSALTGWQLPTGWQDAQNQLVIS